MEFITPLLVIRPIIFAVALAALLTLAITRRAYWHQVFWLIGPCVAEVVFMIYAAYVEVSPGVKDIRTLQFWSSIVDIYMGVSIFVFVILIWRMRRRSRDKLLKEIESTNDKRGRSITGLGDSGVDLYQRLVGRSQERRKRVEDVGRGIDGAEK